MTTPNTPNSSMEVIVVDSIRPLNNREREHFLSELGSTGLEVQFSTPPLPTPATIDMRTQIITGRSSAPIPPNFIRGLYGEFSVGDNENSGPLNPGDEV